MKDDELRTWQDIDHHLDELTRHPGWGALIEYANFVLMEAPKRRILNANVPDWDTYLRESGRCVGIHAVLDAPKIVKKTVDDELARRRERQIDSELAES